MPGGCAARRPARGGAQGQAQGRQAGHRRAPERSPEIWGDEHPYPAPVQERAGRRPDRRRGTEGEARRDGQAGHLMAKASDAEEEYFGRENAERLRKLAAEQKKALAENRAGETAPAAPDALSE